MTTTTQRRMQNTRMTDNWEDEDALFFRAKLFDVAFKHTSTIKNLRDDIKTDLNTIKQLQKKADNYKLKLKYGWYNYMQFDTPAYYDRVMKDYDISWPNYGVPWGSQDGSNSNKKGKESIQKVKEELESRIMEIEDFDIPTLQNKIEQSKQSIKNWDQKCRINDPTVQRLVGDLIKLIPKKETRRKELREEFKNFTKKNWENLLECEGRQFWGHYRNRSCNQ